MENNKLQIPENWSEVSIEQFQELSTYTGENSIQNSINVIACLTDSDPEDVKMMSTESLKAVTEALKWSSEPPSSEFKHTINIDGIDYSMIPKMNEMTVGEWVDIDEYSNDFIGNLHLIMAILYRPLISVINDRTRYIKAYNANECLENAKVFKDKVSVGDCYGAALFFFLIGSRFTNNLAIYLETETKKETMIFEENQKQKK